MLWEKCFYFHLEQLPTKKFDSSLEVYPFVDNLLFKTLFNTKCKHPFKKDPNLGLLYYK